eukprot:11460540-Ditylum_brightwellii.AAC.2
MGLLGAAIYPLSLIVAYPRSMKFFTKASVSSGHKEAICGDSKECFVIVVGPAENNSVICAHYHTHFIDTYSFEKKIHFLPASLKPCIEQSA